MAAGLHGVHIPLVPKRVVLVHNREPEHVPILHLHMVVTTVQETAVKVKIVTCMHAQVLAYCCFLI